ncbi:hypothetical protein K1T71_010969 [Dendrolimus kikuchii]|uniref:Uncharacterized protein n=1 Tax=Dendrolimus kikuchii TaxID=765133 RepID=A0ACC1CQH1_9NEOP|nr:hypothetical protein K1T71_010969 [Dendrolimus kikuchii]
MNIHWWIYVVAVISLFASCLIINFIVKKINELRLEERLQRILHKTIGQSTQVQGRLPDMETRNPKLQLDTDKQTKPTAISLVFNKHDNLFEDKRRKGFEDELKKEIVKLPKKSLSQNETNAIPNNVFTVKISETKVFENQVSSSKHLDDILAAKVENNTFKINETYFNTNLPIKLSSTNAPMINKQDIETAISGITGSNTTLSLQQVDEQAMKNLSSADSSNAANEPMYLGAIYNEVLLNVESKTDVISEIGKVSESSASEMIEDNILSKRKSISSLRNITLTPNNHNTKE